MRLRLIALTLAMVDGIAHGGNHATCFNGGNLGNAVAPQDALPQLRLQSQPTLPKFRASL